MKRIGNLYEKIISIENLNLADEKARKGKTHSYGVQLHDKNREANIAALHEVLKRREYKTSEYSIFTIREPKERVIYRLPYFPDRIVHHAVMNILEDIWVSIFTQDTFSCIKERGINRCMQRVDEALKDKEGTRYCLKLDIRKFYPSIDHEVMKRIIRRKIKCKDTLNLLDEIIDSAEGLPIGNYLSQYLANLYLAYFDHWVKEQKRVRYYFRYADDMVILAKTKDELHKLFEEIRQYMKEELLLEIKDNWQVFPIAENRYDKTGRGLDFVGFVFYHRQKLIRKSTKKNLCRTASRLARLDPPLSRHGFKMGIASWLGWCKYSDSRNLIKKLFNLHENGKLQRKTKCV